MAAAVLLVPLLAALAALALTRAAARQANTDTGSLADCIDALLPQTQCRQCGFDGCRPYAEAIARDAAGIDRCPPGGERTLLRMARLLGRPPVPLADPARAALPPRLARVDENDCIGCLKCVRACPVDAILGAAGTRHAVIPELCTGCELCLPPCPVDCIELVAAPVAAPWQWSKPLLSAALRS